MKYLTLLFALFIGFNIQAQQIKSENLTTFYLDDLTTEVSEVFVEVLGVNISFNDERFFVVLQFTTSTGNQINTSIIEIDDNIIITPGDGVYKKIYDKVFDKIEELEPYGLTAWEKLY